MLLGDIISGGKTQFCTESANIWQVVGYVLLVFKIVIPLILIIMGMIDLGRAVIAGKDDEIKKYTKSLAMRGIAAVLIFFVPTIVGLIMGLVSNFSKSGAKDDYDVCRQCIVSPGKGKCSTAADSANGTIGDKD